jgi:alkanesulfonate monooxygenase
MQLGLMVEPQIGGSYRRLLELARWAEDAGLDSFARSDHYLAGTRSEPVTDSFTSLGGLARETERIELVALVTPLTFRHPAVIAKTAATLDEMSGGRFALGVGTGWMESEHEAFGIELPSMWERFSRLFEVLAYIRAAYGPGEGFRGRHYELQPIEVLPKPQSPRLVVGGSGMRKTPTYAGRFADEYNMGATDRDTFEQRCEVMRQAAVANDREPEAVTVSMSVPTFVGTTEEDYRMVLGRWAARRETTTEEAEQAMAERNWMHGTPDQAAATAARLGGMGVHKLYFQMFMALDDIDTGALDGLVAAIRPPSE